MKAHQIKFKSHPHNYSIIIGKGVLSLLPNKIKSLCPKTKKIALFVDRKVPKKFKQFLKQKLKRYELIFFSFTANEKSKSFKTANFYLEKILYHNLNRSDLIISVGGGITGDVIGFVSSIFKRGINFINIPTTLLAQVDSSIGGKTGINSSYGKNLVGSFYQPKLVLSDTSFLKSLPKKEIICGYAEILKHAIIKDKKFFNWLKKNSENIFAKDSNCLNYAIKKSCMIKIHFVNKDVNEKNLRMILNFGHTFAHAIEIKNNYSNKISHGEAVLSGMILESRLSLIQGVCNSKTVQEIQNIYMRNNLSYTYKKFYSIKEIISLIPFLKNDKKNEDENINFILLHSIGKAAKPNKNKIPVNSFRKFSKLLINRNF
tara:strand:+ start:8178 stop:9296 length:1119 start_codon:yes stop_codon:yes gene_type:complete